MRRTFCSTAVFMPALFNQYLILVLLCVHTFASCVDFWRLSLIISHFFTILFTYIHLILDTTPLFNKVKYGPLIIKCVWINVQCFQGCFACFVNKLRMSGGQYPQQHPGPCVSKSWFPGQGAGSYQVERIGYRNADWRLVCACVETEDN